MNSLLKRWHFPACLLLILFCYPAYAQLNISGRVVDEKNDVPIAGATIYFNNTTVSTHTNEQGNFYFEAIRLLNTEMVISRPGYEVLVYKPSAEQVEKKRIVFKMRMLIPDQTNKFDPEKTVRKKYLDIFYAFFRDYQRSREMYRYERPGSLHCSGKQQQGFRYLRG
ncbi:MAG: carboxypeptidase-like regulatory domain-containing protein [Ferruginibacter sp.]